MKPVDQAARLIKKGGHVHLMGIGGVGMAGLAWLLKERGFQVSGCDLQENRQTAWLANYGISISFEHHESHVTDSVDWLVRSTAVSDSNPEVNRAKKLSIPVSRRGDVLPALMRDRTCIAVSGTHGKTTTTAMIAQVLECGYFVGGEIVGSGGGVAQDGKVMVVEADESDGTVAGYTPDYAVITNIEYDHMEHHDSEKAFIGCFKKLIQNTRKTVFYCAEDKIAAQLCSGNPKCIPYGAPENPLALPLSGQHNQLNASAALMVARNWKPEAEITELLVSMKPIHRRFETVFDHDGIRIISDYAHHPTEIAALIQTAMELKPKRLLGIFQPHRYTRTQALGNNFPPSFQGLEKLWLVPVYAAAEKPVEGGTSGDLAARFPSDWDGRLINCPSLADAWKDIQPQLRKGDLLLIIGAGDIEKIVGWL
jgi:UDP-N-acetylmuramate-alanine ligase